MKPRPMKPRLILASASVFALAAAIVSGCGDHVADSVNNPLTPGVGGSAATPGGAGAGNQTASTGSGGSTPGGTATGAGGTEGTPPVQLGSAGTNGATSSAAQGGSGGMTGAAGAPGAAGAASGGAGGAPPAGPALCPSAPSPSNGVMCTVTCTDPCGIFNLGTRVCTCTNMAFACATCSFTVMDPLLTPPTAPLPNCALADDAQEDDQSGCTDNERCQSIGRTAGGTDGANRFCACRMNEWDCDTKPASFTN